MGETLATLAILWAIVEFVQLIREKPFPQRMVAPAICVAVAGGLMSVGNAPPSDNYFPVFATGVVLYGLAAGILYGVRVGASKLWHQVSTTAKAPMETLRRDGKPTSTRVFDKRFFLLVTASAVFFGSAFNDDLEQTLAEALTPAYVPSDMFTYQWAYKDLRTSCEDSHIKYWVPGMSPYATCAFTPQQIEKRQEDGQKSHLYHWESYTIQPMRNNVAATFVVLGWLTFFIVLGRTIYILARPAIRRATAPKRTRNMEQEFLQMKLLHENGVISDEDFEEKKRQLRARVMDK